MRGSTAELTARVDEEAALFKERLRSDEAKAAFAAFFKGSGGNIYEFREGVRMGKQLKGVHIGFRMAGGAVRRVDAGSAHAGRMAQRVEQVVRVVLLIE